LETSGATDAAAREHEVVGAGFWPRCGILVGSVVLVALVAGPLAHRFHGWDGLIGMSLAAAVCLAGSAAALVMAAVLRGPNLSLVALLAGIFLRMGLPLVLALVVHHQGGPLAAAGTVYYLLLFYLVTLIVETGLSLSLPQDRLDDQARQTA
jgi:hypothetical protein